jgi:hypothetical protein
MPTVPTRDDLICGALHNLKEVDVIVSTALNSVHQKRWLDARMEIQSAQRRLSTAAVFLLDLQERDCNVLLWTEPETQKEKQ